MFALLAASLFFTNPAPLEMPRAEAYLVSEDGCRRLEDRYSALDLWESRAVTGRWEDDAGRIFVLAELKEVPPAEDRLTTRADWTRHASRIGRREPNVRAQAVELLSPVPVAEEPRPPRQMTHGFKEILYWHGTNTAALVCSFRPEGTENWYFASWTLAEGDDFAERYETFEREFLAGDDVWRFCRGRRSEPEPRPDRHARPKGERELLREDVRHGVAAYGDWHFTAAEEFAIVDHLPSDGGFVARLTNDLAVMRAKYAAAMPSPLDGSNTLSVARIYRDRGEYLETMVLDGVDMTWSAAYWSPLRRELVAYLPAAGEEELLKTVRHEAFHQYLSYAASMIPVSPWFNEGYAQYFEDEDRTDWGIEVDLEAMAAVLPAVLRMDYGEFYEGSDAFRRLKYRLAWSVARFIEKGAPLVRFDPFRDLKRDYLESLLAKQDMRKATAAAFRDADRLALFVAEWRKYWQEN